VNGDTTSWGSLHRTQLSVPDNLAVEIERLIVSGALPIGSRFPPERELAELWHVSRSSVRDALRQLALSGFIERRSGRGTTVVENVNRLGGDLVELLDQNQRDLAQVMEIRTMIEPSVTAKAARRASAADLIELAELLEKMSGRITAARFTELDRAFHLSIARATGNPLLVSLLERVSEIVDQSRDAPLWSHSRRVTSLREHHAIDALRSGDPNDAELAALAHLESIKRRITQEKRPQEFP
jgi:GntR family transcriptional repressor for pyruvate dehydrogenase complex